MPKLVYDFAEGHKDLKDLLGGKGANLAEMTRMGLPVPPGFVITTEACNVYLANGTQPVEMEAEVSEHLTACLLYTSPSPRDRTRSRMPSSA